MGRLQSCDWFLNPKRQLVDASVFWYTNIPITYRQKYKHLKIVPLNKIPEKYKRYDDAKILLVDSCYIPNNYKKPFAVSARPILNGLLEMGYKLIEDKEYYPYIKEKRNLHGYWCKRRHNYGRRKRNPIHIYRSGIAGTILVQDWQDQRFG